MKPNDFKRYPLLMQHPYHDASKEGNHLTPVTVNNEDQEKEYSAKGYVAPNLDEEFFNDQAVKYSLSEQLVSILLSHNEYVSHMRKYVNKLREFEREFYAKTETLNMLEQLIPNLENLNYKVDTLHERLSKLEKYTREHGTLSVFKRFYKLLKK